MNRYFRHKTNKDDIFQLCTIGIPIKKDPSASLFAYIRISPEAKNWKNIVILCNAKDLEEIYGPERETIETLYSE